MGDRLAAGSGKEMRVRVVGEAFFKAERSASNRCRVDGRFPISLALTTICSNISW